MIARAFFTITAFLLVIALFNETKIISLKEVASQLTKKKTPPSQQLTKSNNLQKRMMELGSIESVATKKPKQTSIIMNDPHIRKKWGLAKSNALDAWQLTTGSRDIIVAVVDTGIDVTHPDIKKNLWRNPGESGKDKNGRDRATNGIDDDKNGYIDDVHGWNFVHSNNYLKDNHGHGTHIAGIVGAEGGNNIGITGVAPRVSLMILKYFDPKSPGNNLVNTIKAFNYAVKMNAHIINYSGGGMEFSQAEYQAVQKAEQKGILFVAAAGNERSNSDLSKYYPADYQLDNIVSVTAINPDLQVLSTSNYGVQTVDIAAPGEDIYSTLPGGSYGTMTGTSQATAFVSGVAALLMAHNRDFDAKAVKKYVLRTGDNLQWLKSKTGTSKKLNIYRALTMLDQGVGASGVVAANTTEQDSEYFRAPSTTNAEPKATSLNKFGDSLLKAIKEK